MGHTLADWDQRVALWLHDEPGVDTPASRVIEDVAIPAALAQYGQDRGSDRKVVEIAGNGTAYYTIPGFDETTDSILAVEYPARFSPPRYVDGSLYTFGRDPTDVTLRKLVFLGAQPPVGQYLRVTFASSASLPYPTSTAADDLVPDAHFVFVCALAASYCCVQLLTEAMRNRQAAIPTDFVDGSGQSLMLQQAADRLQNIYRSALGLKPVGAAGGVATSPAGPAYSRMTISSGRGSLFHRGP